MRSLHPSPLYFSDISTPVHKTVSVHCAGTSKLALCSVNEQYKRILWLNEIRSSELYCPPAALLQ